MSTFKEGQIVTDGAVYVITSAENQYGNVEAVMVASGNPHDAHLVGSPTILSPEYDELVGMEFDPADDPELVDLDVAPEQDFTPVECRCYDATPEDIDEFWHHDPFIDDLPKDVGLTVERRADVASYTDITPAIESGQVKDMGGGLYLLSDGGRYDDFMWY